MFAVLRFNRRARLVSACFSSRIQSRGDLLGVSGCSRTKCHDRKGCAHDCVRPSSPDYDDDVRVTAQNLTDSDGDDDDCNGGDDGDDDDQHEADVGAGDGIGSCDGMVPPVVMVMRFVMLRRFS